MFLFGGIPMIHMVHGCWATEEESQKIEDSKTKQVQEDNSRQKRQHEKRKERSGIKREQTRDQKSSYQKSGFVSRRTRTFKAYSKNIQQFSTITDLELYQDLYRRSVEHIDSEIKETYALFKRQNRYDIPLLFTADHGESFTERELWFDHGTYPHEQLHIPLIIKYPIRNGQGKSNATRRVT